MKVLKIEVANATAAKLLKSAEQIAELKSADPAISSPWTLQEVLFVALINGITEMERVYLNQPVTP